MKCEDMYEGRTEGTSEGKRGWREVEEIEGERLSGAHDKRGLEPCELVPSQTTLHRSHMMTTNDASASHIIPHHTTLHYTTLHYTTLHYTTPSYSMAHYAHVEHMSLQFFESFTN
jgi:hypothetical protein